MNFTPEDLEKYKPEFFRLKLEGLREAQLQQYKNEWERTRWLATIVLAPHQKKGKSLKPTDLIKFEWEKPEINVVEIVTQNKHIFDKLRP